jgi:hypothetical protein
MKKNVRISIQHKSVGIQLNQRLEKGIFVSDFKGQKHSLKQQKQILHLGKNKHLLFGEYVSEIKCKLYCSVARQI